MILAFGLVWTSFAMVPKWFIDGQDQFCGVTVRVGYVTYIFYLICKCTFNPIRAVTSQVMGCQCRFWAIMVRLTSLFAGVDLQDLSHEFHANPNCAMIELLRSGGGVGAGLRRQVDTNWICTALFYGGSEHYYVRLFPPHLVPLQ